MGAEPARQGSAGHYGYGVAGVGKTGDQTIGFVLKGYPRLSETFIAQEIHGLEQAGLALEIISLRAPTDRTTHPVHGEIRARVTYLPEYVHREPLRCLKAMVRAVRLSGFGLAWRAFLRDFVRDRTRNRFRRLVQAAVLASERGACVSRLHAHFMHTPGSVARYAALMLGCPWTCSAHARDIWTSPDWELADKLNDADWTVTCTAAGHAHLQSLARRPERVHLSHHGLDLERFAPFAKRRHERDGSSPAEPVRLVSVGRAVPKKGYGVLLEALALLPPGLNWRFDHAGDGPLLDDLKTRARQLGLDDRIVWHGARTQQEVLALYRSCDLFVLACRVAPDGDRDGLPNVLVEAASQGLACISTRVSGIPELIRDNRYGVLVEPDDPAALAAAIEQLARSPERRAQLGAAAERRVRTRFDHRASVRQLMDLFDEPASDAMPLAAEQVIAS